MEVRHLRYFVAVAEELNFGRAAARLRVAQPGLSQQIKSLEAELGLRLFDRTKRSVNLTHAGSLLLAEAYAVLGRFDQCLDAMRQIRAGAERAVVRVGMFSEFSRSHGPALVAELRRRHPELLLAMEAGPSSAQVRAVEAGELELAVVRSVPSGASVQRRLLDAEPLGVCLPAGHRLARSRAVRPGRLGGEPLIWMPRSSNPELYDRVLVTLAAAGLQPGPAESTGTASATFALIAGGYGWTLACASDVAWAADPAQLAWRPLAGLDLTAQTWAVWPHAGGGPAIAWVVDLLADIVPAARQAEA